MEKEEINRIIKLANKIANTMDVNKSVFTLEFNDGEKLGVKIIKRQLNTNFIDEIEAYLITFTKDINNTRRYEIKDLKDVY